MQDFLRTEKHIMKKYISNSPEETRSIGREIGKSLRPGDVVALVGDLGAGKTAFVKGVAKARTKGGRCQPYLHLGEPI